MICLVCFCHRFRFVLLIISVLFFSLSFVLLITKKSYFPQLNVCRTSRSHGSFDTSGRLDNHFQPAPKHHCQPNQPIKEITNLIDGFPSGISFTFFAFNMIATYCFNCIPELAIRLICIFT